MISTSTFTGTKMVELHSRLLLATSIMLLLSQAGWSQDKARGVRLQGQSNFRDIGGYKTKDGKTVKRNIIYRSGELSALTQQDVAKLGDLKI